MEEDDIADLLAQMEKMSHEELMKLMYSINAGLTKAFADKNPDAIIHYNSFVPQIQGKIDDLLKISKNS